MPILGTIASSTRQGISTGSFESIASTLVTSDNSVNSITFSSLTTNYDHLQLRIYSRSMRAQPSDTVYMRFNGDAGNNYSRGQASASNDGTFGSQYYPEAQFFVGSTTANTSESNSFGGIIVDIVNYRSTTLKKPIITFDGYSNNGGGNPTAIGETRSGVWNNTAAITSIFLANYNAGDFFKAGTRFSLYGIKSV